MAERRQEERESVGASEADGDGASERATAKASEGGTQGPCMDERLAVGGWRGQTPKARQKGMLGRGRCKTCRAGSPRHDRKPCSTPHAGRRTGKRLIGGAGVAVSPVG